MRAMLFAIAVLGLAACGSKKKKEDAGPSCEQVVDHMLVVMKSGLTGHGSVELGNKKQMLDQCESRKLSAEQRKCMLAAKDVVTLANCSAPPRPTPAPTAPAVPPPAGSGS
jgi:hypothetical protein